MLVVLAGSRLCSSVVVYVQYIVLGDLLVRQNVGRFQMSSQMGRPQRSSIVTEGDVIGHVRVGAKVRGG